VKKCDSHKKADREAFMKAIISVVKLVNKIIMEQRRMVLLVQKKNARKEELSEYERDRFNKICSFYGSSHIPELLERVAPVPVSMAVAQAALESGFGSSDVMHRNNAFFGMMRNESQLCTFDSLFESAIAYSKSLNANMYYKQFRKRRAQMMAQSKKMTGRY
jgi:Bax protein